MSNPATRQRWSYLVLGSLLLLSAQACASSPASSGAPPAAPPAAEAPKPAVQAVPGTARDAYYVDPASLGYELPKNRDGLFRNPTNEGPTNLDPFGENLRAHPFIETAYDQLMAKRLFPKGKLLAAEPICRLCESWEMAPDRKTYTFKLRQNVKWHDGVEFTAQDVIHTFTVGNDPKTGFRYRSSFEPIKEMQALDKHTLKIVTKEPDFEFIANLARPIWIIPKHASEQGIDLNKTAIGTGAFKVVKWERDVELVVERNDNFWLEGRPWAKRMEFKFIPDKSTRTAAFVTKQVDAISVADFKEFDALQKQAPDIGSENYGGVLVNSFLFNVARKPLDDKRIRKAIHLAIDREEMSKALTNGLGVKNLAPVTPSDWQAKTLTAEELAKLPGYRLPKDQDIAEAKRLLAEAGYPEGFKTTSITSRANTSTPQWQEVGSAQLRKIGVIVEQELPEAAMLNDRRAKFDFDLLLHTAAGTTSTPSRNYLSYYTGNSENFGQYSNPEYDRLVDGMLQTFDEKKRWELMKNIQLFLLEELPSVALVETASFAAWQPYVHNWRNYGSAWTFPWAPTTELIWTDRK